MHSDLRRRNVVASLFAVVAATVMLHQIEPPLAAQSPSTQDAEAAKAEHDRFAADLKTLRNQDDFAAALGVAQKTLAAAQRVFGDDAWQSVDARIAITEIEATRKLSPEQLARLKEARHLMEQVGKLYADGKYVEALSAELLSNLDGPAKSPTNEQRILSTASVADG